MPNSIINQSSSHDRDSHKIQNINGVSLVDIKKYCKNQYQLQRLKRNINNQELHYQVKNTEPKNSSYDTHIRLKYVLAHKLMKHNDVQALKTAEKLLMDICDLQLKHRGPDHHRTHTAQSELIRLQRRL